MTLNELTENLATAFEISRDWPELLRLDSKNPEKTAKGGGVANQGKNPISEIIEVSVSKNETASSLKKVGGCQSDSGKNPEKVGGCQSDSGKNLKKVGGCQLATDNHAFQLTMHINSQLSWFAGHYPEQPVLPGVVQVNWASELAQRLFHTGEFRGINALKFAQMILPETTVTLNLTHKPDHHSVAFRYYNRQDETLSTGKILFHPASTDRP